MKLSALAAWLTKDTTTRSTALKERVRWGETRRRGARKRVGKGRGAVGRGARSKGARAQAKGGGAMVRGPTFASRRASERLIMPRSDGSRATAGTAPESWNPGGLHLPEETREARRKRQADCAAALFAKKPRPQ